LALQTAKFYRLKLQQAQAIVKDVTSTVSTWQKYAKQIGLSMAEQERKTPAFNV
jgi:hypothetical protein